MTPYTVSITHLSLFVHQDGKKNAKTIPVLLNRFRLLFDGDLKEDEVRIFELVLKFRKRRRLLPTRGSPCCEKVQEYDLPSILL